VFNVILSLATSLVLHPHIYRADAGDFGRLRGGPAVGVSLAFFGAFTNLEILRQRKKKLSTDHLLEGLSLAFLATGSGIMAADMWRSWRKEK
jgi:hypothetical protein